jgi:lysophospholipase L1-like esterase
MSHVVLLGDSIFDNGAYTSGGPDVIAQLRERVPAPWRATLAAVDGATTLDALPQVARIPVGASHVVLSLGGNDALGHVDLLDAGVRSSAEALAMLAEAASGFEARYRDVVSAVRRRGVPLTICTIYNGNFPHAEFQRLASTALTVFNDAILRVAFEAGLNVIDLRFVCREPEDYANPIEPSSVGGAKIAGAIMSAIGVGVMPETTSRVIVR